MKAWVLHGVNDIRYEEVPKPVPGEGQALVRVMAAGVCGSDIPRTYDTGAHVHPLIIGHEFSGVVEEIGPEEAGFAGDNGCENTVAINETCPDDTGFAGNNGYENTVAINKGGLKNDREAIKGKSSIITAGKRVGIFPLIPCGKCGPCLDERYEMCRNYDYLGSRSNGGFAGYAVVPVRNLIALPDNVSFKEAAMLEPMSVAVHAIRRATSEFTFDRNKKIVVCGLGTIGLLVVMFLLDAGYENLYVIGNKKFQFEKAGKLGIPAGRMINGRSDDLSEKLSHISKDGMADLFFECVGKDECISLAVEKTAPGGRIMLVGNPASDMTLDRGIYWKILRNQLTIFGTWNSSFTGNEDDDWHYVLARLAAKKIDPGQLITHELSLDELEKGLVMMRDKSEDYCKVMVTGYH